MSAYPLLRLFETKQVQWGVFLTHHFGHHDNEGVLQVRNVEPNAEGMIMDPCGHPLPPCIVTERGESLDIWAERARPCLLYTSPSPRDRTRSRMPSSA